MENAIETHYAYNNQEVEKLLSTKNYYLSNGYTYRRLINTVIEIFINEYMVMDAVYHVLKKDYTYDEDNREIENIIFNILASYTVTELHDLKDHEVVSDVINTKYEFLEVYIHDLKRDTKISYKLEVTK
ncbi:hypothetical protein [Mammaliicoccus vitulinus]|uniref:hypothetical protein n=1 Tax=Mammaliicoccus vitulinus TaxID=71237 RepID=UPI00248D15F4|nr:hypothetical protein [Mammaliicoccus vitulinus]